MKINKIEFLNIIKMNGLTVYVSNYVFAIIVDIFKNVIRLSMITLIVLLFANKQDYNGVLLVRAVSHFDEKTIRAINNKSILLIVVLFLLFIGTDNINTLINLWITPQNICSSEISNYWGNFINTDLQYILNTSIVSDNALSQNMTSLTASYCLDIGGTVADQTGVHCVNDMISVTNWRPFNILNTSTAYDYYFNYGLFDDNNVEVVVNYNVPGQVLLTMSGVQPSAYTALAVLSNNMILYDSNVSIQQPYATAGSLLSLPIVQTMAQNIVYNVTTAFKTVEVVSSYNETNVVLVTVGMVTLTSNDSITAVEQVMASTGYNITAMFAYNNTAAASYEAIFNETNTIETLVSIIMNQTTITACAIFNQGNGALTSCAYVQYYFGEIFDQPVLPACTAAGASYMIGKTLPVPTSANSYMYEDCRVNNYILESNDCFTKQLYNYNTSSIDECNTNLLTISGSLEIDGFLYNGLGTYGVLADFANVTCRIAYDISWLIMTLIGMTIVLSVLYIIKEKAWFKIYTEPIVCVLISTTDGSENCTTMRSKGVLGIKQMKEYIHNVLTIQGKHIVTKDDSELEDLDD